MLSALLQHFFTLQFDDLHFEFLRFVEIAIVVAVVIVVFLLFCRKKKNKIKSKRISVRSCWSNKSEYISIKMSDLNTAKYLKIAAAVVLPNVGGWMGSITTRANLKPWYASLNKPKWNPPNFIFAPMWTSIYSGIGYASYLVYEDLLATGNGFDRTAQVALALYANQMALNWAWTPIFFKYHSLKWVCTFAVHGCATERVSGCASVCVCVFVFDSVRVTARHHKWFSLNSINKYTYCAIVHNQITLDFISSINILLL